MHGFNIILAAAIISLSSQAVYSAELTTDSDIYKEAEQSIPNGFSAELYFYDAKSKIEQQSFSPGDRVRWEMPVNIPKLADAKKANIKLAAKLNAGGIKIPFKLSLDGSSLVDNPEGATFDLPYKGKLLGEFSIPKKMPKSQLTITAKFKIKGVGSQKISRQIAIK